MPALDWVVGTALWKAAATANVVAATATVTVLMVILENWHESDSREVIDLPTRRVGGRRKRSGSRKETHHFNQRFDPMRWRQEVGSL